MAFINHAGRPAALAVVAAHQFENCDWLKNSDRSRQVEGAYEVLLLIAPVIEG